MALSVTHVIGAIFVLDIFRHYVFGKKSFPRYLLIIGGIAGLFPDIDLPLGWFLSFLFQTDFHLHGLFTHSFLFPMLFLIAALLFHCRNNLKWAKIFYVIAAGWLLHLVMDCLLSGMDKLFFWPFTYPNLCPLWHSSNLTASIDAIILVLWLVHEELHHKIKDYF